LFDFIFPRDEHQNPCAAVTTASNSTGTVYPSSNLDLRQFPHWTAMPNLELFANAGFPFTRFADLSHTVVVLPQQPAPKEITAMLDLLAYFGAQTGYPALRVQVGDNSSFDQDADLLVIGSASNIVLPSAVAPTLPVALQEGGLTHRLDTTLSLLKSLWARISRFDPESFSDFRGVEEETRLDRSLNESFDSLLQMAKSPSHDNRSIVMLVLGKGEEDPFPSFLDISSSKLVSGNLSIQHGSQFDSFTLDPGVYYVGHISAMGRLRARMHQAPWLGVLFPFVVGILCAPWVHTRLRNRAQKRLRGDFA
jgi:cellulose synthase (UDP-forming)